MNAMLLMATVAAGVGFQEHDIQDNPVGAKTHQAGEELMDRAETANTFGVHRASDLVGTKVKNPEGEDLGEIEDLVLSPDGHISYAVLSFGGFMDIGDKLFALPWHCLGVDHTSADSIEDLKNADLVINVPKERLKNAPGFEGGAWPEAANTAWCAEVDTYYAQDKPMDGRAMPASAKKSSAYVLRCTDLKGKKVENMSDEKLGDVKDLVLDPHNGRVAYAIVSVGGFLGMGDRHVAVPWEAMNVTHEDDKTKLHLDINKERLEQAPEFKDDEWDRMGNREWIRDEVYGFYGVQPYWNDEAHDLRIGDIRDEE